MRRQVLALDSGIGGLGIVGALRRRLPDAAIAFLADHDFFPYGALGDAALSARLAALLDRLIPSVRPDVVVIACNTASTIALAPLRARFPLVPFVGCVPPVKWAAAATRTGTIGLLATGATVRRAYVQDLRERHAPGCRLLAHGSPHLASFAEARFVGAALPAGAVAAELDALFDREGGEAIDVVCLGCTHYGLLMPELREAAPRPVEWLDPADAVARRTEAVLAGLPARAGRTDVVEVAWTTRWPADRAGFEEGFRRHGFPGLELHAGELVS